MDGVDAFYNLHDEPGGYFAKLLNLPPIGRPGTETLFFSSFGIRNPASFCLTRILAICLTAV
ncbi:uncharacterized protein CLUP02_03200 [Colletotrichum lupini]|uniref:Uncharacterized protein n=1 Tax=Colletotrichum lupini TaxID=145971 RepID=A0A9Q8SI37_9PEZI|nr:uncharacterized protein CLUP02_03200 [Colletotrichum lupini]UQC77729.1 hypothetical protein CLUP02_03200 [Colletotrichum lupini]